MNGTATGQATRTALVTGAGGFLGRYIVRHLVDHRWRVVAVDRHPSEGPQGDKPGLSEVRRVEWREGAADELLATFRPDVIVHAAGPASVPASIEDPAADFRASVDPLHAVLEAVRRAAPACRIVFLSSAAVYGNPRALPISEDAAPAPLSPYGFHKLIGEHLIAEYHRVFGLLACSVRIFSAYGPGLRRQVLWDAASAMLRRPSVTLLGTGEETRDFVHASDVARGIGTVIESAAFEAEVYNLASGCETSIRDLARMLAAALGQRPDIRFSGAVRKGDPLHWRADIRRLARLGYQPGMAMERGVREFAAWVQGELCEVC